jgi:hypothetical protein
MINTLRVGGGEEYAHGATFGEPKQDSASGAHCVHDGAQIVHTLFQMKISRILSVAAILTLLACGAAFTQTPSIPPGAGVGVHRLLPAPSHEAYARSSSLGKKAWPAGESRRGPLIGLGRAPRRIHDLPVKAANAAPMSGRISTGTGRK